MSKEHILDQFKLFSVGSDGIGGWLGLDTDDRVFHRLEKVDHEPLAKVVTSVISGRNCRPAGLKCGPRSRPTPRRSVQHPNGRASASCVLALRGTCLER